MRYIRSNADLYDLQRRARLDAATEGVGGGNGNV